MHLLIVDGKTYVEGQDFHVDEKGMVMGFAIRHFSVAKLIWLPKDVRVTTPTFEK